MEVAASDQSDKPRRRGKGRPFPSGVSGNPFGRWRGLNERAAKLYATMVPDFAPLTAVEEVLLRQACYLFARSQCVHRLRDVDVGVRMSGEARRLLQTLRRKHGRKGDAEPSLTEYLAATYPECAPGPSGAPPAAKGSAP
jgi:hypothetical protein